MRSDKHFIRQDGSIDKNGLVMLLNGSKIMIFHCMVCKLTQLKKHWTTSPKSYASLMIDDSALGLSINL
jgi:hypothetical protein